MEDRAEQAGGQVGAPTQGPGVAIRTVALAA
jgi:hypothetical protein